MEKQFHKSLHWLHHHLKKFEKYTSQTPFAKLFESKHLRLAIVIIIALAIPLTVLAVQQIQDIRQRAAEPTGPRCDGVAVIYKATPDPVTSGQFIIFSKTDGSQVSVETNRFGNGYIESTCTAVSEPAGGLKCQTKSRGSGSPVQYHKWQKFPGGTEVCWYAVAQAPTATPNPNRPTSPPRTPGGNCTGELKGGSEIGCSADNKPRLRAAWDLRGATGDACTVTLVQGSSTWVLNDNCDNKSGFYIDSDKDRKKIELKPNTDYDLKLANGGNCNKVFSAKTANCGQGSTAPGGAQATNTPAPGQATNTPAPAAATCKDTDVHLDKFGTATSQSFCSPSGNIELNGGWKISGTKCKVTLYENGVAVSDDDKCVRGSWSTTTFDGKKLTAGNKYQLKATSDICTTQKLESDIVEAKACEGPATPTPTKTVCPSASGQGIGAGTFSPDCITPTPTGLRMPGSPV